MTMTDPLPLVVAEEDVVAHALEMAPIARLAAHGLRVGSMSSDHPTSHVWGDESATRFGMRVTLDPSDPVLLACGADAREGLSDFHLVVDVRHQFIKFLLLPLDRSRPACIVTWSMREDRAELEFDGGEPTNHDVAAIADRTAVMLESVVDTSSDEAMEGMDALQEAARTFRLIAFAELGLHAGITAMSNDHGSDLVVIAYGLDEEGDIHFAMPMRKELALPRAQIKIGMGTSRELTMDDNDGRQDAMWPSRFEYTVHRRSAESSREDDPDETPDVLEAMRIRQRFAHLAPPLAVLDIGSVDGQDVTAEKGP